MSDLAKKWFIAIGCAAFHFAGLWLYFKLAGFDDGFDSAINYQVFAPLFVLMIASNFFVLAYILEKAKVSAVNHVHWWSFLFMLALVVGFINGA